MTPWQEFKDYNFKKILNKMRLNNIIDPYGVINYKSLINKNLNYHSMIESSK